MIFFYALGGGLGHLLRARAALNTLYYGKEAILLSSCKRAAEFLPLPGVEILSPPSSVDGTQFSEWLEAKLRYYSPDLLAVDAFPSGLFGELPFLGQPSVQKRVLFSRLLNFPAYERICGNASCRFDQIYLCEQMPELHLARLRKFSSRIEPLDLIDPLYPEGASLELPKSPFWIVDHSGSLSEVQNLLAFARDVRRFEGFEGSMYIHSNERGLELQREEHLTSFLFTPLLYPFAAKIFTGAGFHAMRQAGQFPEKHLYLPFERRFDDQFIRAAVYSEARKSSHSENEKRLFPLPEPTELFTS